MSGYQLREKIMSWIPEDELGFELTRQLELLASMPFIFKHIAVMPDCHIGIGASVGTCIPTLGAIIPAAVGVDIGCGMIAVKLPIKSADITAEQRHDIRLGIERRIPVGRNSNRTFPTTTVEETYEGLRQGAQDRISFYDKLKFNWGFQLGSLGGGNHFIEIIHDENDDVWAFLHSGSRGIGNKIAIQHMRAAKDLMKKFHIELPHLDLAYLPSNTEEFNLYTQDLLWAQEFAYQNRLEMMNRVLAQLGDSRKRREETSSRIP